MSSILLHSMRPLVRFFNLGRLHVDFSCSHLVFSSGSGFNAALVSWIWVPIVCPFHVRQAWIWKRKYYPSSFGYCTRLPCVSTFFASKKGVLFLNLICSYHRPLLLWKYGKRIRMSSRYASKQTHPRSPPISAGPTLEASQHDHHNEKKSAV